MTESHHCQDSHLHGTLLLPNLQLMKYHYCQLCLLENLPLSAEAVQDVILILSPVTCWLFEFVAQLLTVVLQSLGIIERGLIAGLIVGNGDNTKILEAGWRNPVNNGNEGLVVIARGKFGGSSNYFPWTKNVGLAGPPNLFCSVFFVSI